MSYLRGIRSEPKRGIVLTCLSVTLLMLGGQVVWAAPKTSGADLAVTQTDSPDPVMAGRNLTYSITVRNGGPLAASNVTLRDELPTGVSFVSSNATQGTCSGYLPVICNLGSLAKEGTARVEIVVTPGQAGDITNTASVSGKQKDNNQANNQSTESTSVIPPPPADLSISMTDDPDPYVRGSSQTLVYTITVHNSGPGDVASARVLNEIPKQDDIPGSGTFYVISAASTQGSCFFYSGSDVYCNLGELQPGDGAVITISVFPLCDLITVVTVINSARVLADEPDPIAANNEAKAVTAIVPASSPLCL